MTEYLRIGRREVKLTHPDKVLFAKAEAHQARPGRATTSAWPT